MAGNLLLGLLLSGAGMGLNILGANKARNARNDALAAERVRQNQLDDEAALLNQKAQARYEDFGGQQEERKSKLTELYQQAPQSADAAVGEANASAAGVMPTATNDIVTREVSKQSENAKAYTDQQGAARAGLTSFGDLLGDVSLLQGRDASQVAQIGGFKRGSSSIMPYELEEANQKGAGLRLFGDILGGIGSMGVTSGITNGVLNGSLNVPSWLGGAGTAAASVPSVTTSSLRPVARPTKLATGYL